MIIDKSNLFSEGQELTTGAEASTNVIDLGAIDTTSPITHSKYSDIFAHVVTAFVGGTNTKVAFQTDDDVEFGTAETIYETPVVLTADLVAGYKFNLHFPKQGVKRYARLLFTTTGTHTAGKITAGLVEGAGIGPVGVS